MICRCDSFGVNYKRKRVFKLIIIFEVKTFRRGGEGKVAKLNKQCFGGTFIVTRTKLQNFN